MARTRVREQPRYWREPVRFPWLQTSWWLGKLSDLDDLACGKNPDHGTALPYYLPTIQGKSLGYKCVVCGWDKPVLVQEGFMDPCVPSTELVEHTFPRLPGKAQVKRGAHRVEHRVGSRRIPNDL